MIFWMWIGLVGFMLLMVILDLTVFHPRAQEMRIREALGWTTFWILIALTFSLIVPILYRHHWFGAGFEMGLQLTPLEASLQFITGYLIEKTLSIDMFLAIAFVFSYFHIPLRYQYHLLYLGVLGALILRTLALLLGAWLITFFWMTYVFGIIMLFSATRMLIIRHDNLEPGRNLLIIAAKHFFPVQERIFGEHFFVRENGRLTITPLFLVFLLIQSLALLFSIDAVPAIYAITADPFLVFTANAFALLGLTPLYFTLVRYLDRLQYFKMSLVFIMAFVGTKMFLLNHVSLPTVVTLAIVLGMLFVGTLATFFSERRDTSPLFSPIGDELKEIAFLTLRQARRIIILIVGASVMLIGVALIVLPGPAFIVIPAGLAILATEFLWAKKLLKQIKSTAMYYGSSLMGQNHGSTGTDKPAPRSSEDTAPPR